MSVRPYEALFIINPQLEDEAVDALVEKLQTVITTGGGEIEKLDKWGKKRLAYEVKGFTEGFYVVIDFKGEPAVSAELERIMKITDEILRYLLVRRDD